MKEDEKSLDGVGVGLDVFLKGGVRVLNGKMMMLNFFQWFFLVVLKLFLK
jgi:hypothetical protein